MPQKMAEKLGEPSNTLYLIDVSSFIYRAFYAIRNLRNKKGEPTNAVYGVANMLARIAEEAAPEYMAVVYDSKEPSFRKQVYKEYKANRSAPPEELIPQFPWIERLVECMQIPSFRQSGIEADDLIAALTKRWLAARAENRVIVVSGDKDLMQLVDGRVRVWDTMNEKIYGAAEVEEKFGVRPDQIRDYLALVGDSSDNVPGVAGIGPKSAVDLLKQFQDLEGVLTAAQNGKIPGKKGETIKGSAETAKLSARLVTLESALEVACDRERLHYHFHVTGDCATLLRELDFHSLLKKWSLGQEQTSNNKLIVEEQTAERTSTPDIQEPETEVVPETSTRIETTAVSVPTATFHTVDDEQKFSELLRAIERAGEFGFDLETTSLNPRAAEPVGVAIAYDRNSGFYIPIGHRSGGELKQLPAGLVFEKLRPFLENPRFKKIGQNLKYDWSVLCQQGLKPDGIGADTMVAAYVLDPEGRHNLETLSGRYLNYSPLTFEQVCGSGKDQLGFDQVDIATATRYSAEDAWLALVLWDELKKKLNSDGLMQVFATVDLPLVKVLSDMECEGVRIDEPWLRELSGRFSKELREIETRIQAFTGGPVNLNSPKQLARLLFEELKLPVQSRTKTGPSTDASVLEALAPLHEVPRLLLEYREIAKLKGTYVDPLPALRDPKTGKIHASFHQTVTATGRLSSSDPNLQNIPIRTERGKLIRRAFIPSEGGLLVSADYSQIELRLLAHMSGDPELTASFRERNEDVHRRTAAEIFGISPSDVTDRQRGIAKAVNFGLMYGKTAFGLSQELKIPRREAQDVITRYFERYKGVKEFLDRQVAQARETGCTTTLLGRKRYLNDINSKNHAVRSNAERMAMNAPIQGSAADLMKIAMTELDDELKRRSMRSKLIIQVHDEVVLDCPADEAESARNLVVKVMENALQLSVPLKVESSIGKNWMDL